MTTTGHYEFRSHLRTIRRRLPLVLAFTLIGALAAAAYAATRPAAYVSSARVLIQPDDPAERLDPDIPAPNTPSPDADRIVANELQILETSRVAARAATRLRGEGIRMSAAKVDQSTSAAQIGATNVIRVTARTPRRSVAPALANAVTAAYLNDRRQAAMARLTATVNELDRYGGRGNALNALNLTPAQVGALRARLLIDISLQRGGADVVEASTGVTSAQPSVPKFAVLGGLVGLLLALSLAFFLDQSDDTIRSSDDVERVVGVPTLVTLPLGRELATTRLSLPSLTEPDGPTAEKVRQVRSALHLSRHDAPQRVLVTGAAEHGAHATVAANVAIALGRSGARTALIEGDTEGALHTLLAHAVDPTVSWGRGWGDLVEAINEPLTEPTTSDQSAGWRRADPAVRARATSAVLRRELASRMVATAEPNTFYLPFGKSSGAPTDVVTMAGTTHLLETLSQLFDAVVIDAPGPRAGNAGAVWARYADAILLVANAGVTTERDLSGWSTWLGPSRELLAGVVLCAGATGGRRGHHDH